MRTRRKIAALACSALLIVGVAAASLAYLTSHDTATNTFTIGRVEITLDEKDVDNDANTNDNVTVNGVTRDTANAYKLIPGGEYEKDPTVTVKAGSEDCYVRAMVTVTKYRALLAGFTGEPGYIVNDGTKDVLLIQNLVKGWNKDVWSYAGCAIDDKDTPSDPSDDVAVYEFRYAGATKAPEGFVPSPTSDTTLEPVFTHVYVPGTLSDEAYESLAGVEVDVVAHAIQESGFANADAAWGAWQ